MPIEHKNPCPMLIVRIADHRLALSCEEIVELVPLAALIQVPGQVSSLLGFLNLRQEVIPVISLGSLLGLSAVPPGLYMPIVVLKAPNHKIGLLVDRAETVCPSDSIHLHPVLEAHIFNDCADYRFEADGCEVAVLRSDRLLLKEERQRLFELQSEAARRLRDLEAAQP